MKLRKNLDNYQIKTSLLVTFFIVQLYSGMLSACRPQPSTYTPEAKTEVSVAPSSEPIQTPTLPPSPPFQVWIDPSIPGTISEIIAGDPAFIITEDQSAAIFEIGSPSGTPIGYWTYLLVTPFYSSLNEISNDELVKIWKEGQTIDSEIKKIILSPETYNHFSSFWGKSDPAMISQVAKDQIVDILWYNPGTAAIIPFEELSPPQKVIRIDNQHPLQLDGSPAAYPLSLPIHYHNAEFIPDLSPSLINNFDPERLTSVALTGVTALVRDTAAIMEEKGILYPAEEIAEILISADITHINNEVPFDPDCPPPSSEQNSLSFCSSDKYIDLFDFIGADVIEISGDHFGDKGPSAVLHTIDLYQENNYQIYGGGINLQAGLAPIFLEHNGNKFAFIGCNAKAQGYYADASENSPGAAECDFDWMVDEITNLVDDGYAVIATMQHEEVDSFFPIALQVHDFQLLAEAGASIVSGSQAHHPQGFEFFNQSFIHYGLGNLFFDQWYLTIYNPDVHKNKDKSTIDIHYFYGNQHINTIVIPLQFIDNAKPRMMTFDESDDFLGNLYYASKWNDRWIYLYPAGYFEPQVIP